MCTVLTYQTKDHYFGRNLDLPYIQGEQVTITPRNYTFQFRHTESIERHYAIIGMSLVIEGYPLYFDATNEKGLSIAGLNFPDNAYYQDLSQNKVNIASFELIPYLLSQFTTVKECKEALLHINITHTAFSSQFPPSPLHWQISDFNDSIVVECMKEGLFIYDNPLGVMTNNPPFNYMLDSLNDYRHLMIETPANTLGIPLKEYCVGLGAKGLPGDLSSKSRYIRTVFNKLNAICDNSEEDSISTFFHILQNVSFIKGTVMSNNQYEVTLYSSCVNMDKAIYYYTTYTNSQITAVSLFNENLESTKVITYSLITSANIKYLK